MSDAAAVAAGRAWPPQVPPTPAGVVDLVRQVSGRVQRTTWPRQRTLENFCLRSPDRVLAEGDLCFTTPCAELSSLTAIALRANGLRPTLVLTAIKRAFQVMKFQCGLELELEGQRWVIGFGIAASYCYAGQFVETRRRPLVLRFPPDHMDPTRPYLGWLSPGGIEDLPHVLPGYVLAPDVAQLARRGASRFRYAWHRRRALNPKRAEGRGRVPGGSGRWA